MKKIGYLNPKFIIISVGLLVLGWAFGSYIIYSTTFSGAKVCIPPIDGCVYISKSANYHLSSIFYRATILPTTILLSIANYFILQYLKYYTNIRYLSYFLFLIAVIIAPTALNITEALPNGSLDYGFKKLHNIFAGISFASMIIFELLVSIVIVKVYNNIYSYILITLSLLEILLLIIPEFVPIHEIKVICQWNLMITISIWFIIFGSKVDRIFKLR